MSANRFLFSLVAALFLSTLASADSIKVIAPTMRSAAYDHSNTDAGHFSTNAGKATSTMCAAHGSPVSAGATVTARLGGALSGTVMHGQGMMDYKTWQTAAPGGMHETRFRSDNWTATEHKHALSTPEPGSLMLLSTGLMGITGMVRRKLQRGV